MRLLLVTTCLLISICGIAQDTKTSIGFILNPNFSSVRYIANNQTPQSSFNQATNATKVAVGLSGGLFFQYELSDKFFITWGLGVQNYRYTYAKEVAAQVGSPTKRTYSQYYLQLNTSLKYRFYRTLYARVGFGADVIVEPRVKITQSTSTGDFTYKEDHFADFKEVMVPISLGLGYELKLTDRLNLVTELFGTAVVTDAIEVPTDSPVLRQRPWQLGFSIGVIRSF